MRKIDISGEVRFRTARSGGKGGQHVNKVETMVVGLWDFQNSALIGETEKEIIRSELANRINSLGYLFVSSQRFRTQSQNKEDVLEKMHELVFKVLKPGKKRKKTRPSAASVEKRLRLKKKNSELKGMRMANKVNRLLPDNN